MTQEQQPIAAQSTKPGQMTATMRAIAQPTGPKVMRIGVVQDGKVIEERVVKQRVSITVGPSEKSMFVIPTKALPPTFKLFEVIGGEYVLNVLDGMTGRIQQKTGVTDLAALRAQAKKIPLGSSAFVYQTPLTDDARGKIVIGEMTFLFQFVAPPPVQPKPQLPVTVQAGLSSDVDWTTTIVAAFSFLFHFGAVGSIYSDWMDPVVDDEVDVQALLESVKQLPPPPPVETPKETTDAPTTTSAAATEAPKSAGGGGPAKGSGGRGSISDAKATAITNELNSLQMQMLGALSSTGSAASSVLNDGNAALGLLENATAGGSGVGFGGIGGLNIGGGGGGSLRPGAGGERSLTSLGNTAAAAPTTAGSAQKVKGPVGNANIGGAAVSGGAVSNASSVVASMGAGFRRCYNRGLQEDPAMKGSVRITAKIGPNGEVLSASPSGVSGLSGSVVSCVVARVQSAQFAPPEGGGATIVIPVSFVSQ